MILRESVSLTWDLLIGGGDMTDDEFDDSGDMACESVADRGDRTCSSSLKDGKFVKFCCVSLHIKGERKLSSFSNRIGFMLVAAWPLFVRRSFLARR